MVEIKNSFSSDNVDHPVSLYAATKKSNEVLAHAYSHIYKVPTTGLRFFTVYGLGVDIAFLFTKAILENKPIDIFNNGDLIRDFTIDDIVESLIRVIEKPATPDENFNHYLLVHQQVGLLFGYLILEIQSLLN